MKVFNFDNIIISNFFLTKASKRVQGHPKRDSKLNSLIYRVSGIYVLLTATHNIYEALETRPTAWFKMKFYDATSRL